MTTVIETLQARDQLRNRDEIVAIARDLIPRELHDAFVIAVVKAVAKSFKTDTVLRPVQSRDEAWRRARIALDGFKHMRGDLGYTPFRAADEMYGYLRATLDGNPWSPRPAGGLWGGPS